jgi:hypothetical protein
MQTRRSRGVSRLVRRIFLLVGACATTSSPPAGRSARADICTGLTDDACQQVLLDQSICMASPDQLPCRALRKRGLLPPPAPSVDELAGCYTAADNLDGKLPSTTLCFERDRVATFDGAWDEVAVAAWHRDDTPHRAIWVVDTVDGVSRWVAPEGPGQVRVVSDGGRWNVHLVRAHTSVPPDVDVEATCKALHECAAEVAERRPTPPLPPSQTEIDFGGDDNYRDPDPKTLRSCAFELDAIVQRERVAMHPLPATCRATSAP